MKNLTVFGEDVDTYHAYTNSIALNYTDPDLISILLSARTIVDSYRDIAMGNNGRITPENRIAQDNELIALGFTGYRNFTVFNTHMCMNWYKVCRPIKGTCDLCVGHDKTPPCKKFYLQNSCYPNPGLILDDRVWLFALNLYQERARLGVPVDFGFCPEGHGFQKDVDNYSEPPFDISWK